MMHTLDKGKRALKVSKPRSFEKPCFYKYSFIEQLIRPRVRPLYK